MTRAASIIGAVLLVPVLAIGAATGTLQGGFATSSLTAGGVADIPPRYLALYQAAGARYGVPWEVLAGVGKVECDHGRLGHPACRQQGAENFAGAGGPMQFLAGTWAAYGVDADGDGHADRWSAADAVFGAANYLRASGAPQDLRGALFAYNHSSAYVDEVLVWAQRYRTAAAAAVPGPVASADGAALRRQVLAHPRIALRPDATADVDAGRVDPRLLAALLTLASRFEMTQVGPFASGHAYNVAGTSRPSNHAFGRAVDIPIVNGQVVSPSNSAARQLAVAAGSLPAALRPTEIGSPFAGLPVAGAFTDADHQNHLHLGFDQ